ncbi:hypothetical protein R80B4_00943 [Fibrobacteres bacterium R8-0-B4]
MKSTEIIDTDNVSDLLAYVSEIINRLEARVLAAKSDVEKLQRDVARMRTLIGRRTEGGHGE